MPIEMPDPLNINYSEQELQKFIIGMEKKAIEIFKDRQQILPVIFYNGIVHGKKMDFIVPLNIKIIPIQLQQIPKTLIRSNYFGKTMPYGKELLLMFLVI